MGTMPAAISGGGAGWPPQSTHPQPQNLAQCSGKVAPTSVIEEESAKPRVTPFPINVGSQRGEALAEGSPRSRRAPLPVP